MGTDGHEILEFLKQFDTFVSPIEIAKKVGGKRRFNEDPDWARPVLFRLLMEDLVEANEYGHYRVAGNLAAKCPAKDTNFYYSMGRNVYVLDDDQPFALVREALGKNNF
jgi:hypothetical protein